jgi:hypothetical protein
MVQSRAKGETATHRLPSIVRTRVTAAPGWQAWTVERVTWLTPYAADEIANEARRAGPSARLEVIVPASTGEEGIAAVESLFGWLREKGLEVAIRREEEDDL